MANIIKSLIINNFRGIKDLDINFDHLNVFIGNNGTNKTNILEAINFALSPSFLSSRIKAADFFEGTNEPINIVINFRNNFKVQLLDGYTTQEVECNKISLTIKKREQKSRGKVLSDLVVVEHIVLPDLKPKNDKEGKECWSIRRKKSKYEFIFDRRLLSFNVFQSKELPRSFYFSKEREKQLSKGFNTTFSSILDDFNWRFSKVVSNNANNDIFNKISETKRSIIDITNIDGHDIIKRFNESIKRFNIDSIGLSIIDKSSPFDQGFLAKIYDKFSLPIKYLGSGIEMIYSILFLDAIASLSKEKLIILIDEPELHLHPNLQEKLAHYLLELSKDNKYQIFITTHSPIFLKTLVNKENVKSMVTKLNNTIFQICDYTQNRSIFPWGPTWGEINYFAYDYPTIEFHNELYGYLQEITEKYKTSELDTYLSSQYNIEKNKKWIREKNGKPYNEEDVTLMTFIRHKVHHPENKTMQYKEYSIDELKKSVEKLIRIIGEEQKKKIE